MAASVDSRLQALRAGSLSGLVPLERLTVSLRELEPSCRLVCSGSSTDDSHSTHATRACLQGASPAALGGGSMNCRPECHYAGYHAVSSAAQASCLRRSKNMPQGDSYAPLDTVGVRTRWFIRTQEKQA